MTDDYLAISNTGKNITITMTPGMKQRVMQDYERIRLVYSTGHACFWPTLHPIGRKIIKRKNVWNVSMASARCPDWPIHERAIYRMAQIEFQSGAARVLLPKPAPDIEHPAMNRPVPRRDEPAMSYHFINLAGEYFGVKTNKEDADRFWKAYLRTLEKTEARHLFNTPDMVVAAITGAFIGFWSALALVALLTGLGWVK